MYIAHVIPPVYFLVFSLCANSKLTLAAEKQILSGEGGVGRMHQLSSVSARATINAPPTRDR